MSLKVFAVPLRETSYTASKSQGVSNLVSSSQASIAKAKGEGKNYEMQRTKSRKKDTNTKQIKNQYCLTSESYLVYRTYPAGVSLSLPAWHKPKLKLEDIFRNAGFFCPDPIPLLVSAMGS